MSQLAELTVTNNNDKFSSGFPETSETAVILKAFERKLLIRLNQLSQSSNEPHPSTFHHSSATLNDQNEHQPRSIGPEGIVGFKRRLIQEQTFVCPPTPPPFPRCSMKSHSTLFLDPLQVPTSDSLLAGMSMSQSIKLQEQNLFRERELATTESLSRLNLGSSGLNDRTCEPHVEEANELEKRCHEKNEEEDEDEIILSENDRPDVERAWELAYQAGFTRGPGDMPERMLPAD
ncbi:hypothetical protein VP01_1463g2 [Puccinia sorghi]|uniref:Uncharacterized protein n=1 Tax=Puccinia sorghi TaxID=27349 RepID=A0A0L6VJS9_9BASI|nr:hypothetical protein VP01_1463g2 [Puccinia sorghi]